MDWITWFTGTVQVHLQSQNEDVVEPAATLGIIKIGSLEMPNDITRGRVLSTYTSFF